MELQILGGTKKSYGHLKTENNTKKTEKKTSIFQDQKHEKWPHLFHKYEIADPDVGAGDGALPAMGCHLLVFLLVDLFVSLPPTNVINGLADHCNHDDKPLSEGYKVSFDCFLPCTVTCTTFSWVYLKHLF